jgi:uncharacterized protein (TIGR03083 family)
MSDAQFADWVAPIALHFASTRREVAEVARRVPEDVWGSPSPVPGWAFKDVLAHLAEGDVAVQNMIQVVLDGGDTDFREWNNGREDRIAAGLQRGAALTIEELKAQVIREGEETQGLFARLGDDHESLQVITSRTNPTPMTLVEALVGYHHDEEHLEHLRPALAERSASS